MIKWPSFKDIFSFRLTYRDEGDFSIVQPLDASSVYSDNPSPDVRTPSQFASQNADKILWNKIKFDNLIRAWIAIPAYLACFILWTQKVIPEMKPISIVFAGYGVLQYITLLWMANVKSIRRFDFVLCVVDLVGMSLLINYTGGMTSALYFIYFIPLVVHAFHRDWALVLFYGFGSVLGYAAVVLSGMDGYTTTQMTELGTRLFFMLLTVSIACLALTLLRRHDALDQERLLRLKCLTAISQTLNQMTTRGELDEISIRIIGLVREGLGANIDPWVRFLFVGRDPGVMHAVQDPNDDRPNLKKELAVATCPAMKGNNTFRLDDAQKGHECPTENFSFGSHICIPVSGTENESFGILFVGSALIHAFKREETEFLNFVARSLGLAIQRLHRMEELRKAVEMNSCVMAVNIASSRSLEETSQAAIDGLLTILKVDQASLMIWDPSVAVLRTLQAKGEHASQEWDRVFQMGEGVPGKALEKGDPIWSSDWNLGEIKSILSLPLKNIKGEPLGVLNGANINTRGELSPVEFEIAATYAARAALALENALAHRAEREQIRNAGLTGEQKAA